MKEFSSTFPSPDPNKVLHDMTRKKLLERVGWGKYKVNSSEQYLAKRTNIAGSYDLLKEAGMRYALTGPDAVFFWTKGGYQADRFFGSMKMRFYVEGQPSKQTLFGVFYVLYPDVNFETEEVGGFCLVPLKEAVEFCQNNIYSYEPALEMLDEMYHLGLHVRYMETKTNV